ncbi:hypothetical protein OPW33_24925 [Vibrio europaeus]|uniref:hypothetical protein n=1 Tax=Vibrio europaeus TaxID=300876 RepID=UPI0023418187|nr:hypothetical protein [Vibrio europaeus]MDC5842550.1 hypothetical protein [Vibrio europaeus]
MISQSLPTDNLYKFMSLFGLVMIICSSVFKYVAIKDIQVSVSELMIEQSSLSVMSADSAELEHAKAKLLAVKERLLMNEKFDLRASVFIVLGIILSIAGFALWYFKTQRLLDQLLRRQVELGTDA